MRRSVPTVVLTAVLTGLAVAGVAPLQAQESDVSAELARLYEGDQADRRFSAPPTEEQWAGIAERDRARRNRVMELVRAGALESADDYYHAAMVLQHGDGSEDILIAHILATVAGFEGHAGGRWLSAASLDRYLHRTDQPQRLGTQYVRPGPDGPWTQGAYEAWLPDAVRKAFGEESREEQRAYLKELNGTGGARPPIP